LLIVAYQLLSDTDAIQLLAKQQPKVVINVALPLVMLISYVSKPCQSAWQITAGVPANCFL
jgi:hypothetical protein